MTGANSFAKPSKRARIARRLRQLTKIFKRRSSRPVQAGPTTGVLPITNPPTTALPPKTKTKLATLIHGRHDSATTPPAHPASIFNPHKAPRGPPHHLTLLGLPLELRHLIYEHLYTNNGDQYIQNQLLGFPTHNYSTYSPSFTLLLTSRQIHEEAFPFAYRLTSFYWFKSWTSLTYTRLSDRLNARQAKEIRSVAFWSNPYLCEDFLSEMVSGLPQLRTITVCSNYMSGPVPLSTMEERVKWILKIIDEVKTLREMRFLTGCGISASVDGAAEEKGWDCGLAEGVRRAFDEVGRARLAKEGIEVGGFDGVTREAVVRLLPRDGQEGGRAREVKLKVASAYDEGNGTGLGVAKVRKDCLVVD